MHEILHFVQDDISIMTLGHCTTFLASVLLNETPSTTEDVLLAHVGPTTSPENTRPPPDVNCSIYGDTYSCTVDDHQLARIQEKAFDPIQWGVERSFFMLFIRSEQFRNDLVRLLLTSENIEHAVAISIPNLQCKSGSERSTYGGARADHEALRKEARGEELTAAQARKFGLIAINEGIKAHPLPKQFENIEQNPFYLYILNRYEFYDIADKGSPATFLFALDAHAAETYALIQNLQLIESFTDLDGDESIPCSVVDQNICSSGRAAYQEVDVAFNYDPQSVSCNASIQNIVSANYMLRTCTVLGKDHKFTTYHSANYKFNSDFRALVDVTVDIQSEAGVVRATQTIVIGAIAAQLGGSVDGKIDNATGRKMVHGGESARRNVYARERAVVRASEADRQRTPRCRPLTQESKPEMVSQ